MQKLFTVAAALVLVGSIACGKSEAEKQAELAAAEAKKAADAAAKVTEAAGKATEAAGEDMAKGMPGNDGKTVEVVSFQSLETTLPQVSGWTMKKPRGERMTAPIAHSRSETTYTKGDTSIDVEVIDSGFAAMLVAPWSMMLATGFSRESSDGYEKAVSVSGQPGFEKWDSGSKDGELNLLVNKRFLVSIEGNDLADTKVLHEFADKMDFAKFAALK
jgi:hypothetical protein